MTGRECAHDARDVPLWTTDQFGPRQRTEAWAAFLCASHLPWTLARRPDDSFSARLSLRRFLGVRIVRCNCGPLNGSRASPEIARSDDEYLGILYVRRGREQISVAGQDLTVDAGNFVLWDSGRPMSFRVPADLEKISLLLPFQYVTEVFPEAHDYCGRVVDGRRGLGAVFANLVESLDREMWSTGNAQLGAAMAPTLEVLRALFNPECTSQRQPARDLLLQRVKRYILNRLREPLHPAKIAAANGISVRYLHQLFGETGTTVCAWIREKRLGRCLEELQDTSSPHSVTEIAHHWGFCDSSHFSKSFKKRFGRPPNAVRSDARARRRQPAE
jgi:AraC-like DNA-binding protein